MMFKLYLYVQVELKAYKKVKANGPDNIFGPNQVSRPCQNAPVLLSSTEVDSSGGGPSRPRWTHNAAASTPYECCCDEETDHRHAPGEAEGATSVC